MSIITTNAPVLIDRDGDLIGYDLPKSDPIDIDTRWITRWGREDELVYVVTWDNGITADLFSLPNEWSGIFHKCSKARFDASAAKLDAALEQLRTEHMGEAVAA